MSASKIARAGIASHHSMETWGAASWSYDGRLPDLEQLERVGRERLEQREHLRVHDAPTRREPLHVALAIARGRAQRVGVVHEARSAATSWPSDGSRTVFRATFRPNERCDAMPEGRVTAVLDSFKITK